MSIARIVSVGQPAAPQGGSITIGGFDTPQGGRIAITQAAPVEFPVGFPPGTSGQVVGYGPGGAIVPVNLPAVGGFPAGTEGQIVGYAAGGTPAAIDPDTLSIDLGTFN